MKKKLLILLTLLTSILLISTISCSLGYNRVFVRNKTKIPLSKIEIANEAIKTLEAGSTDVIILQKGKYNIKVHIFIFKNYQTIYCDFEREIEIKNKLDITSDMQFTITDAGNTAFSTGDKITISMLE